MISSLNIKNYQSWADGKFNFHPGLNVIIGLSDSGKSAIIRALRWLVWNRPLGNEFQSDWGGETIVDLTTTEGITISRSQDKNGNEKTYTLSTLNKPLKAFGTDVPKEISDALNINGINFHQQQDSFFLLKDTPGEVTSHFNKIANLEKIGIAQFNIKKWINAINSIISYKTEDLKKEKEKLLKYDFLETFEIKVEELEYLELKLNFKRKNKQELEDILDSIISFKSKIEQEKEILKIEPTLNQVLELVDKNKKEKEERDELQNLVNTIIELQEQLINEKEVIPAGIIIDNLLQLYQKKEDEEKEFYNLQKLVQNIENGKKSVKVAEQEYNKLHKEFEKEMGSVCLLCGSKLSK